RERPHGPRLEPDADVPLRGPGTSPGRIQGRMALAGPGRAAPAPISRGERMAFTVVMMAISAAGVGGIWLAKRRLVLPSGEPLNRMAWEGQFTQRSALGTPR